MLELEIDTILHMMLNFQGDRACVHIEELKGEKFGGNVD